MDTKSTTFLKQYLQNASPVGHETTGQHIWLSYLKPYIDEHFVDNYGTVVGILNPGAPYKVVIEAHADEISWLVNYIDEKGYIYVIRNGGADYSIAPSMHAHIHTAQGRIPAVFGWPAIHVRDPKKPINYLPKVENVVLDCGCSSAQEVRALGIHPGNPVIFDQKISTLQQHMLTARGLDNRIGGFIIAEVVRRLHEQNKTLPFTLYVVNAVQEEIGLKGAHMIAHQLQPDVALVTDVTHDTQSPCYNKIKSGDIACGKGPVLNHGPSIQRNVLKMLMEVAEKEKIPYQHLANASSTGTDADAIAYAHTGIPTALISLPMKYMHTTVEMVHHQDVQQVIALLYHFLLQLKTQHDFRYSCSLSSQAKRRHTTGVSSV